MTTAPTAPLQQPLGIRDLHRKVQVAIARELRGAVRVRAEIAEIDERNQHCFLTLAEPARDADEGDASLDVVIWRQAWARIRRQLDDRNLSLRKGMTVTLGGELQLRPGSGELRLKCSMLDTDALLGELAARRLAVRQALAGEGLLDANRNRALAPVPLRIGLVASLHSQGYQDFCHVLDASGFRFLLVEHPVLVQGVAAPTEVAVAVEALGRRPLDIIVIVRGGGARADLDAFDSEVVARAIALAPVPVWTGLGHTGDRCLADDLCHSSHATPTACAQALVAVVHQFHLQLMGRAGRLAELGDRLAEAASEQLQGTRRVLARSATGQLDRSADAAATRARSLRACAGRQMAAASVSLAATAARLPGEAGAVLTVQSGLIRQRAAEMARTTSYGLDRSQDRLRTSALLLGSAATRHQSASAAGLGERARWLRRVAPRTIAAKEHDTAGQRRVLGAFDPTRQLERGWTLTFDAGGTLVRRATDLRPGQVITSRFFDGERISVVEGGEPA